jgi:hypothetical protein
MKENKNELRQYLQGCLAELNKLAEQIRQTRDYSESAEYILCLREMITEQIETTTSENTSYSAHQAR